MFKRIAPVALAVLMAGTLAGCPETNDELDLGGGGGIEAENQPNVVENRDMTTTTTAENSANQLALDWGTNMIGDKRNMAEGFTRAAWLQANLAAGEWEQAGEDLNNIQEQIQDLANSENIPMNVRNQIVELRPLVSQLSDQIVSQDRNALSTSNQLVDRYSAMLNDRNTIAWMSERQGGGAGAGDTEIINREENLEHRNEPHNLNQ